MDWLSKAEKATLTLAMIPQNHQQTVATKWAKQLSQGHKKYMITKLYVPTGSNETISVQLILFKTCILSIV